MMLPAKAVEIIAHRGASHDAPENTLAAVKLGWKQANDGVEIDIHLTKDGKIVAIHDFDTKRTAGKDLPVVEQTLEELRKLDAGAWKGDEFRGERIPTLDEILATVPEGKRLFIEIKCGPEILPEMVRAIQRSGKKPEQLVVIAFGYETLRASKELLPELEHYFLAGYRQDRETGEFPRLEDVIERSVAAGFEGINLDYRWPIDRDFVAQAREAGLKFYVWTVDDPAVALALRDAGVDGITTNRPLLIQEHLGLGGQR
jgi:glycerophosphoryl diester phosphodiesterase